LDPLPEDIDLAGVAALRTVPRPAGAAMVTVGVGGDHLAPVDLDLAALGGCFVICGPGRSGRSTALATIAGSLDGPLPVVAVAPRPSPLRSVPGATVVSADGLAALLADDRPLALVIDDGELIDDHGLQTLLERFVRGARDRGSLLIAAASTEDVLMNRYRGWLSTARRDRCGLLLNPTTHLDGEAFDLRLPRTTSGNWPAGRGLLVTAGETRPVQVATTPAGILR